MIALVRQIALIVALLGLVGQSAAYAMPKCDFMVKTEMAQSAEMAAMADCMKGEHKTDKGSEPCKGMTPGCMARAGCTAPPAIDPISVAVAFPATGKQRVVWSFEPPMHGRTVPPDLHPPAFLV